MNDTCIYLRAQLFFVTVSYQLIGGSELVELCIDIRFTLHTGISISRILDGEFALRDSIDHILGKH